MNRRHCAIRCFCELRACLAIGNREQISGTHFTVTFTFTAARHRISSRKRATGGGKMASTASLGRRMFSSSRRILDNTPDRKRVVVAMSGGVDSSVAAHLLRESHPGADIVGLHVSCFAAASQLNLPCTACGQLGAMTYFAPPCFWQFGEH